ncbi:hypothetical protein C900_00415 [Fulvivirga imtechensis AK7]|uniref:NfeD-like C-terminal domain-containing protein n=1 Tax=Fulvivirga imtechensis AK7 TaxID=1237149 RepID=L8JJG6_9BACT|nr:hypothetical protein C900_00415 [Fulvivirga imtechensis AK7]
MVSIILILIDVFILSDITTHIAYILLSLAVAIQFDASFLYQLIIGILSWFVVISFHYFIWKRALVAVADKYIAPKKHINGISGKIGCIGTIKIIDRRSYVEVDDELYQFVDESSRHLNEGDQVKVKGTISTKLII